VQIRGNKRGLGYEDLGHEIAGRDHSGTSDRRFLGEGGQEKRYLLKVGAQC